VGGAGQAVGSDDLDRRGKEGVAAGLGLAAGFCQAGHGGILAQKTWKNF
jgi:hypothetical protein